MSYDLVRQAYDAWSASYDIDDNLTRDLDADVVRRQLADRSIRRLLELGCGTGKNTPFLRTIADQVIAVDFSEGMLAEARTRAGRPALVQADLTAPWPVPAASIDLVVADLVLEHIADLEPVFAEARRVLRPGGRFFLCELHPFWQYGGKQATFRQGGEQVLVPAYLHHVSDFWRAAGAVGLAVLDLREWWHDADAGRPPRLLSLEVGWEPAG